jgi:hypothetical protein
MWSGRRDLNPRPRPWQGRALPTELLPRRKNPPHRPTLPGPCGPSTIGAGAFHFRVRNGNGWFHAAKGTGILVFCFSKSPRHRGAGDLGWGGRSGQKGSRPRTIGTGQLNASRRLHLRPHPPGVLPGSLPALHRGRPHLGAGFPLRCFQRLSLPHMATQLMPLEGQLGNQRCVPSGPLVLGRAPLKPPAPVADRDRTVSRRSEPSSRAALMGEQPNPWDLLQPRMRRADIEVPNLPAAVDARGRSACYPRGNFYPLIDGPSTRDHRFTRPGFRPCSACRPHSQAPLLPLRSPADFRPA